MDLLTITRYLGVIKNRVDREGRRACFNEFDINMRVIIIHLNALLLTDLLSTELPQLDGP